MAESGQIPNRVREMLDLWEEPEAFATDTEETPLIREIETLKAAFSRMHAEPQPLDAFVRVFSEIHEEVRAWRNFQEIVRKMLAHVRPRQAFESVRKEYFGIWERLLEKHGPRPGENLDRFYRKFGKAQTIELFSIQMSTRAAITLRFYEEAGILAALDSADSYRDLLAAMARISLRLQPKRDEPFDLPIKEFLRDTAIGKVVIAWANYYEDFDLVAKIVKRAESRAKPSSPQRRMIEPFLLTRWATEHVLPKGRIQAASDDPIPPLCLFSGTALVNYMIVCWRNLGFPSDSINSALISKIRQRLMLFKANTSRIQSVKVEGNRLILRASKQRLFIHRARRR